MKIESLSKEQLIYRAIFLPLNPEGTLSDCYHEHRNLHNSEASEWETNQRQEVANYILSLACPEPTRETLRELTEAYPEFEHELLYSFHEFERENGLI